MVYPKPSSHSATGKLLLCKMFNDAVLSASPIGDLEPFFVIRISINLISKTYTLEL